jgi:aryl sulfotransferase
MTLCVLASYPKSGNTWLRALLTACLRPDEPLVLDELAGEGLLSPQAMTSWLGCDVFDLSLDQLDEARSALLRRRAAETTATDLVKVHGANRLLPSGRRFGDVPRACVIYVVRDPLDVAVSYARFMDMEIEAIAALMGDAGTMTSRPGAERPEALPELISSWSEHVAGWVGAATVPTTVLRYEDLLADPGAQLRRVVDAVGLPCGDGVLAHALEACSFEGLRRLEVAQGFSLTPPGGRFFRSGRSGEGTTVPAKARQALLEQAGDVMRRMGYAT